MLYLLLYGLGISQICYFFYIMVLITYLNLVWYKHSYYNRARNIAVYLTVIFSTFEYKVGILIEITLHDQFRQSYKMAYA